jgi:heme exporter protein B
MSQLFTLIVRDIRLAFGRGGVWLPVIFFLLVATLYPFGVGPDGALLARTGGGVLWIAALLASLLPIDRLIAPDAEAGILDQFAVRGISDEWIAGARVIAHWLTFGPPLMLAAVPAAGLLRLSGDTLMRLEFGLLLGTPGLAALSVMVAALTAGLRGAGALAGLLLLPLAIPLLIFGAGSLEPAGASAFKLIAACSMFLLAVAPFAAGGAIRAMRE